jgi:uncharacterized protein (DUF433 family)
MQTAQMGGRRGPLIALGEGVYTVPEVVRILQPSMTVDKVRYWLHKGLLGEPLRWGSPGKPHLLSFQQLLRIRTIQHLREKLEFPLQKVTPVIEELSDIAFFAKDWHELRFFWTPKGEIGVSDGDQTYEVATHQLMIPQAILPELESIVREARKDWARGEVAIENYSRLVSNPRILAGSPTVKGTRVQTSFVAYLAQSLGVERVLELYPNLDKEAVLQAAKFEDKQLLAA